ncbi:transposase [Ectobacillus ponti]|uniref:Transposase n=1 Tax=Ectobacillus ponti TaxID=2961894 RepID=A0AA41XDK4_9BACI|nr:transposase [Ectobacillus ponti]MCP8970935.1 transposase [Ectobacillus ponti]
MRRSKYFKEFKIQVVQEAKEVGNKAAVAGRYEVHENLVKKWVKEFDEHSELAVQWYVLKELEQENDQLKRLLGEKDLEIAILRDLLKKKNPHLRRSWK